MKQQLPLHRGAFCQFPFRQIYYYGSNKSTGKDIGKTHLCALCCTTGSSSNLQKILVNCQRNLLDVPKIGDFYFEKIGSAIIPVCIALLLLSFFRNPCCDVESGSISSAPASSSLNYLRLLPSAARTNENSVSNISEEGNWRENSNSCTENGYVTPRPSSVITCGCQTLQSSQYQNLSTDHTCPSTTSSVA